MARTIRKSAKEQVPVVDLTGGNNRLSTPLGASFARAGFTRVMPGNPNPLHTSDYNLKKPPTPESLGANTSSKRLFKPVIIDERVTDKVD